MTITTVLFDLDGTVLDTVELILASYRHVRESELAGHAIDPDHFRRSLGVPLEGVFRELVGDPARVRELIECYRAHNRRLHDGMVSAFAGIPELLAELGARGLRTGIVTSKMRAATLRGLELSGIAARFEVVVSVEDVTRHKPHPEPVERALALLGAKAPSTLFIGDSPADIGAGRAAGVRTGAALWGPFAREELAPHGPDHWFAHPGEVLGVL